MAARRLGLHVRTGGGLAAAARHAAEIGCNTLQIMSGNPSAWNPGTLQEKHAAQFREAVAAAGIEPVFLHAGYLINISCRKGRNAPLYAKSLKLLQDNLDRAAALGCRYVVVHMGSRKGESEEEALKALAAGLDRLRVPEVAAAAGEVAPVLLLENGAGSGDTVGSTFEEIAEALAAAEAPGGAGIPLGVCLDTAHMWGAGYDLSSKVSVDKIVEDFARIVGIDRLRLIHFNDAAVERGSKRDRHEHPGNGVIPLAGLRALARHPRLADVPLILETPGAKEPGDEQRMKDLKRLAGV